MYTQNQSLMVKENELQSESVNYTNATNLTCGVDITLPDTESRGSSHRGLDKSIRMDKHNELKGMNLKLDEVIIVLIVLAAWLACILLFFNKWGKIRMLEAYQPQYRVSFSSAHSLQPNSTRMNTCVSNTIPLYVRSSDSRSSMIITDRDFTLHNTRLPGSGHLYECTSENTYHHPAYRSRLNSVFVGSPYHRNSLFPVPNMPRKVKSAEDLKTLVVHITGHSMPSTSTTVI